MLVANLFSFLNAHKQAICQINIVIYTGYESPTVIDSNVGDRAQRESGQD